MYAGKKVKTALSFLNLSMFEDSNATTSLPANGGIARITLNRPEKRKRAHDELIAGSKKRAASRS